MKIINFQPVPVQMVNKLQQVQTMMQFFGLGDDGKIYQYNIELKEWALLGDVPKKKSSPIVT